MSKPFKYFFGLLVAGLFVWAGPSLGCSCYPSGPPCQAYGKTDVIFVGTPIRVSQIELKWNGHLMTHNNYRFRVSERLKGVKERELDVVTNAQGGACGYKFELGTEYVVYAHRDSATKRVGTGLCSRTRPLARGAEDVQFARTAASRPAGSEIFGTANRYRVDLATGDRSEDGWVANAKVTATAGANVFTTVTGADGKFRFSGLMPGKYSVAIEMPADLSPQRIQNVEVADRGCAQVDYYATLDGRIQGRLVDQEGKSGGIEAVELIPLVSIKAKQPRTFWDVSDENGNFDIKNLPPGQYILGLNVGDAPDKDEPHETTYYPRTRDPAAATIFTLGSAEKISGIEFQVPPPLTERAITGQVVWPDGRPALKATVDLTYMANGHHAGFGIKVDAAGRFSAPAFEGVRYGIRATVPDDPNWDPDSGKSVGLLVSPEQEVTPNASAPSIRLVIDVDGDGTVRTQRVTRVPAPRSNKQRKRSPRRKPH